MSTAAVMRFAHEEYLARERVAEYKNEYGDGLIVAMDGGQPHP